MGDALATEQLDIVEQAASRVPRRAGTVGHVDQRYGDRYQMGLFSVEWLTLLIGVTVLQEHVAAHGGDDGNCQADLLANSGADQWLEQC